MQRTMTKVKGKQKSDLLVPVLVILVVVVVMIFAKVNFDIVEAKNILTPKDMYNCMEEFGHVNYYDCLQWLNETGQKDLSTATGEGG